MALFFECIRQCAQELLETANIVRDAIFHQVTRYRHYAWKTGDKRLSPGMSLM